jgi:hypothetical protein
VLVSTISKPAVKAPFPSAAVEAKLRDELLHAVESIASMHGVAMPAGSAAQSTLSVEIDSLVVVDLLCAVEPVLGMELKDHVVKAGGYSSINEAVDHLMPRIEKEWAKYKNKVGNK